MVSVNIVNTVLIFTLYRRKIIRQISIPLCSGSCTIILSQYLGAIPKEPGGVGAVDGFVDSPTIGVVGVDRRIAGAGVGSQAVDNVVAVVGLALGIGFLDEITIIIKAVTGAGIDW